jgi:predicted nucleic acid-binding Zn ribbon protein
MADSCPKCSADVDATDRFCRECGYVLSAEAIKWHHRRGVVLLLLFLVLGPLALRLLWSSPAFTTRERILCTIASVGELLLVASLMVNAYVSFLNSIAALDQL